MAKKKTPAKKTRSKRKKKTLVRFDPPTPAARPSGPPPAPWSCAGRTASRTAAAPVELLPPLEVSWKVRLGAPATAAPVVSSDGVVHAVDRDGRVAGHELIRGAEVLKLRTDPVRESSPAWPLVAQRLVPGDKVPVSSAPALLDNHLLFGDDEGIFYGVRRGEAAVLWRKGAPLGLAARQGGAYAAPFGVHVTEDDLEVVVTIDAEGTLYAADARSGRTLYSRFLRGRPAAPPALGRAHGSVLRCLAAVTPLYAGEPSALHAIDLRSGDRAWHSPLPEGAGPGLLVVRDLVVTGGPGGLAAFSLADGARLWSAELPVAGPLASDDEVLFAPLASGEVVALFLADGAVRWRGEGRSGAPVVAGTGLALTKGAVWSVADGGLVAWELAAGRALGRVKTPGTPVGSPVPCARDGEARLVVATATGNLVALAPA
jgi:outer membrane protein assembly factor BamB